MSLFQLTKEHYTMHYKARPGLFISLRPNLPFYQSEHKLDNHQRQKKMAALFYAHISNVLDPVFPLLVAEN